MLGVDTHFEQGGRASFEQQGKQAALVLPHQGHKRMRYAEDQVIVTYGLADLLAYPAKTKILHDFSLAPKPTGYTSDIADTIERKYNRRFATGEVMGYGKILIT